MSMRGAPLISSLHPISLAGGMYKLKNSLNSLKLHSHRFLKKLEMVAYVSCTTHHCRFWVALSFRYINKSQWIRQRTPKKSSRLLFPAAFFIFSKLAVHSFFSFLEISSGSFFIVCFSQDSYSRK